MQNSFLKIKKDRKRGFSIYILWNKEIRLNINYKFRDLFVRVS